MENLYSDFGIKIFDNFLTPTYFYQLQSQVLSQKFSWNYHNNISNKENKNINHPYYTNELWHYGFSHLVIYDETIHSKEMLDLMLGFHSKILDVTDCEWIVRSRFDMTTFSDRKRKQVPHVDLLIPNITCVFYLTESDAPTVIYNERLMNYEIESFGELYSKEEFDNFEVKKVVYPKENRIVMFDGSYFHTGFSPEKYKNRITLNVNVSKNF